MFFSQFIGKLNDQSRLEIELSINSMCFIYGFFKFHWCDISSFLYFRKDMINPFIVSFILQAVKTAVLCFVLSRQDNNESNRLKSAHHFVFSSPFKLVAAYLNDIMSLVSLLLFLS